MHTDKDNKKQRSQKDGSVAASGAVALLVKLCHLFADVNGWALVKNCRILSSGKENLPPTMPPNAYMQPRIQIVPEFQSLIPRLDSTRNERADAYQQGQRVTG
jgi:hypothetical protein